MKIYGANQPYQNYQLAQNDGVADYAERCVRCHTEPKTEKKVTHPGGLSNAEYEKLFKDETPYEHCSGFNHAYKGLQPSDPLYPALEDCMLRFYYTKLEEAYYMAALPPEGALREESPRTPEEEEYRRRVYHEEALPPEKGTLDFLVENSPYIATIGGGSLLLASAFASLVPPLAFPALVLGGMLLFFTVGENSDGLYYYSSIPVDEYNKIHEARNLSIEEKRSELMQRAHHATNPINGNGLAKPQDSNYPNRLFDITRQMAYDPYHHQYIGFDPQAMDSNNQPRWRAEGPINYGNESLEVYRDSVTVDANGNGVLYDPSHSVYLIENGNGNFQIYDPRVVSNENAVERAQPSAQPDQPEVDRQE